MTPVQEIKAIFNLSHSEANDLDSCIQTYSSNSLMRRILNACCCLCCNSNWQIAERILRQHAYDILKSRFGAGQGSPQAVSQYVLHFLVSQNRTLQPLLDQPIDVNEMIDRAAFGDGENYGMPPRAMVIALLESERNSFIGDVDVLEHYIKRNPLIAAARDTRGLSVEPTLQSTFIDPNSSPSNALKYALGELVPTSYIENTSILNNKPTAQLYYDIKALRRAHEIFKEVSQAFRTDPEDF